MIVNGLAKRLAISQQAFLFSIDVLADAGREGACELFEGRLYPVSFFHQRT